MVEDFNQQGSWLNSYRMKYVEYEPEKNWQLKMLHLPSRFRCIYSSLPTGLVIENINHVACWVCLVNLLGQGLILSFNWMKITKFNRYLFTSFVNLWSLFIILNYVWNLLCFDSCIVILPSPKSHIQLLLVSYQVMVDKRFRLYFILIYIEMLSLF